MIRHPINSAVGRARPDLNRVADGIAASLRQFSISATRCAGDQNNGNGNDNGDDSRQLSSRARAAAAVNELIANAENTVRQTREQMPRPAFRRIGIDTPLGPGRDQGQGQGNGNEIGKRPNVIGTPSGFKGVQRVVFGGGEPAPRNLNGPSFNGPSSGPKIIRGGFRGRGGFQRGGGIGAGAGARGGGGFSAGGFGGGRGGSRGRGRGRGRDDRPRRGRGGMRAGEDGELRGRRRDQDGEKEQVPAIDDYPEVKEYLENREIGESATFNPTLSLDSLTGWGPALATSASPFAQSEAVLRQARVLGGGHAFHPSHLVDQIVLRDAYTKGTGMFIPPSEDGQVWVKSIFRDKEIVDGRKVYKEKKIETPPEVKTAVLEDALLGKYDGPQYAETNDTLGVLASYARRDGTWNAAASRGLEEKVRSLLAGSRPAKPDGAKPEAKA
ncbi:hypothetical protein F4805DRAFT_65858 [Annulohypoxylon moriforme]|nr:hypothetical protein F4805DRAFT_65858 [Annulohypoxylon moriforme]